MSVATTGKLLSVWESESATRMQAAVRAKQARDRLQREHAEALLAFELQSDEASAAVRRLEEHSVGEDDVDWAVQVVNGLRRGVQKQLGALRRGCARCTPQS